MPAGLEMTFRPGNHKGSIVLNRIQATDLCKRRYYARAKTKTRYNLTGAIRLSEMLPRERNAVLKSLPTNFLFTSTSALSEYDDLESEKPKERTDFSAEFSEYLSAVSGTTSGMFGFLRSVTYVGPLRAKPCRHYDLRAEEVESVGVRGEHVASLLKKTTGPKKRLLNQWVQRFGFGNRVRLVELTESLASIEFVQNDGESLNIADLGFGASQLFPLIVQAVSARQYTLTIAEQPEVHLHPRLQALLGNLFVQLANQGQRVLLETHSEHMLLRIRTLVAKGEIDANNVAIYFVSCEDGISEVQRVHIGEDGHIKPRDWPKGFFDDALRESIDLAKAQIKRREVS
jgi:predicted ATPase